MNRLVWQNHNSKESMKNKDKTWTTVGCLPQGLQVSLIWVSQHRTFDKTVCVCLCCFPFYCFVLIFILILNTYCLFWEQHKDLLTQVKAISVKGMLKYNVNARSQISCYMHKISVLQSSQVYWWLAIINQCWTLTWSWGPKKLGGALPTQVFCDFSGENIINDLNWPMYR